MSHFFCFSIWRLRPRPLYRGFAPGLHEGDFSPADPLARTFLENYRYSPVNPPHCENPGYAYCRVFGPKRHRTSTLLKPGRCRACVGRKRALSASAF